MSAPAKFSALSPKRSRSASGKQRTTFAEDGVNVSESETDDEKSRHDNKGANTLTRPAVSAQPRRPNAAADNDEDDDDEDVVDHTLIYEKKIRAGAGKKLGEPVIVIRSLRKHFKLADREETVQALKDVNLNDDSPFKSVRRGEFLMIRGPSGGGKTTLLNILGTIDEPTDGSVELFGEIVDAKSKDNYLADLRLRKIGFVFQTFNLIATMSAFENVELPMTIAGKLSERECKRRAIHLLERVGLGDRIEHLPSELSGGEQQRVTIARALANEPEVLLLDEPTGDLDTRNTIEIMDLLLTINQTQQTTCIMVTHNPDLECYADRILYVEDGKFKRQAINAMQTQLELESYMAFVNAANAQS